MEDDDHQSLFVMPGLFGAPVHVHVSMVMLMVLFITTYGIATPEAFGQVMTFFVLVLAAILFHEWGHAWGAHVQGIAVQKVELHGAGGTCYTGPSSCFERELIVAMGPLTNLALWALSSLLADHVYAMDMADAGLQRMIVNNLDIFAGINLFLFLFNMLPLQPLDGGKLLNLALLRLMQADRADRVTGWVGLGACLLYVPVMVLVYMTFGMLLLFFPSFRMHRAMATGRPVC